MESNEITLSYSPSKHLPELDALISRGGATIDTVHVDYINRGSYAPEIDDFLQLLSKVSVLKVKHLRLRRLNLMILETLGQSSLQELTFVMCMNIMPVIELLSQYDRRPTTVNIDNCYLPLNNQKTIDFFTANLTLQDVKITYKSASEYDPYRPNHSMADREVANKYQADADRFRAFLQQLKKTTSRNKTLHHNSLKAAYCVLLMQKFSRESVFAIINRDVARIIAGFVLDTKFDENDCLEISRRKSNRISYGDTRYAQRQSRWCIRCGVREAIQTIQNVE